MSTFLVPLLLAYGWKPAQFSAKWCLLLGLDWKLRVKLYGRVKSMHLHELLDAMDYTSLVPQSVFEYNYA